MNLKGLIFREFYIGRKKIILTVLFWLLFVVIGILMQLSMIYGNMADKPADELAVTKPALLKIFMYFPVLILMAANLSFSKNIYTDYNSKWSLFAYTTPISEYKYVGIKFLVIIIMSFVTFLSSLANAVILLNISENHIDGKIVFNVFCIVLTLFIIFSVLCTLAYTFRSEKKTSSIIVSIVVALYALIMGWTFYMLNRFKQNNPGLSEEESEKLFYTYTQNLLSSVKGKLSAVKPFLSVIIIAFIVLLYFLCVKAMKRRDS